MLVCMGLWPLLLALRSGVAGAGGPPGGLAPGAPATGPPCVHPKSIRQLRQRAPKSKARLVHAGAISDEITFEMNSMKRLPTADSC
jgi:hypothetical protein